jgi:uncharacterized protein
MINRELYIDKLVEYIDKPLIKVITGLRRCGKSVLLELLHNELINRGIKKNRVIYINFESFEFSEIDTAEKLYQYIKPLIVGKTRHYILLDEIQEVESWEKAVNSFRVDFDADIYITGSNSHMLSSDLATYLAGRYVELSVFTLSFSEYLVFRQNRHEDKITDNYSEFKSYMRLGGFPVVHAGALSSEMTYKVVYDIYSSVILRDAIQRHNIRDVELLERVVKFVFDNVGNKFSAKSIADYFKSQNRRIDLNTVYNYLNALKGAFVIYKAPRYDIKGKEILKTNEKYYVSDQSLLYSVMGYKDRLISGVLENIIMLELKRRGYRVFVGKSGDKEIDFVAEMQGKKIYIQVTYKMGEPSTIEHEFAPLLEIRDNFPKYVVSMDESWNDLIEGIVHMHIADFLLMPKLG